MKKILFTLALVLTLGIGIVYAAPTVRIERTILPEATNLYDLGTSTKSWRNLFVTATSSAGHFVATSTTATSTFAGAVDVKQLISDEADYINLSGGRKYLSNFDSAVSSSSVSNTQIGIYIIGDSWMAGDNNYPIGTIKKNLQISVANGGDGFANAATSTPFGGTILYPSGVTRSSTGLWTSNQNYVSNGYMAIAYSSIFGVGTTTFTGASSQVKIFYLNVNNGDTLNYAVNGAATSSVSTANAATSTQAINITGLSSSSTNRIDIWSSGSGAGGLFLIGTQFLNSTGVYIDGLGISGSRASHWINLNETYYNQFLSILNPKLVVIMLGVNDELNDNTPSGYQSNLITIVNRIKSAVPNVSVLLMSPADINNAYAYPMSDYVTAMKSAAISTNSAFLNNYELFGEYSVGNARGLYTNPTHLNSAGYELIGRHFLSFVLGNAEKQLVRPGTCSNCLQLGNNSTYVGINTATPVSPLTVSGNTTVIGHILPSVHNTYRLGDSSHYFNYAYIKGADIGGGNLSGVLNMYSGVNADINIYSYSNGYKLNFGTGSVTNQMTLNAGNLGIGTTSPFAKLSVVGETVSEYFTATSTTATSIINGLLNVVGQTTLGYASTTQIGSTGSAYFATGGGNVGIGTTSPWGKLSVTNTGTDPSFIVEDSTSPDTTPFIVDASGNVGIGTTTPNDLLALNISSAGGQPTIRLTNSDTGYTIADGSMIKLNSSEEVYLWNFENTAMRLGTNNTERLTILNTGNVGIGTTSPSSKLHVYTGSSGYVSSAAGIQVESNTNQYLKMFSAANTQQGLTMSGGTGTAEAGILWEDGSRGDYLSIYAPSTEMVLKSGNVGIGTTGPEAKLHVSGANENDFEALYLDNTDASTDASDLTESVSLSGRLASTVAGVQYAAGKITFGKDAGFSSAGNRDGNIKFSVRLDDTLQDYMIIKSGGNVGIGTTSPAVKLDINGYAKVLQTSTTTACSAAIQGSIFYNQANDGFWGCGSGGVWKKLDI